MASKRTKNSLIKSSSYAENIDVAEELGLLSADEQEAVLRAREHSETLKHRAGWSYTLIGIAIAINIMSVFVVVAIGFGWMHYDNDFAVPAIIGANFAETWALTKIAMKFYFNSSLEDNKK